MFFKKFKSGDELVNNVVREKRVEELRKMKLKIVEAAVHETEIHKMMDLMEAYADCVIEFNKLFSMD